MCVLSLNCVWFFATPWTAAHQAPLSRGSSRQKYWRGLPFSPPGDLPDPEMEPTSPVSLTLAGDFRTHWATWEALSWGESKSSNPEIMFGNNSHLIFLLVYLALMDLMWGRCLKLVEGLMTMTVSGNGASLASSPPALFGKHHPKIRIKTLTLMETVNKKINTFLFLFLAELRQFIVSNVPLYSEELELIFFP